MADRPVGLAQMKLDEVGPGGRGSGLFGMLLFASQAVFIGGLTRKPRQTAAARTVGGAPGLRIGHQQSQFVEWPERDTAYYNVVLGIAMRLGRFGLVISVLAFAGGLYR